MNASPARLNALELSGVRLPGLIHAVANHLAKLAGAVEILGTSGQHPPEEFQELLAGIRLSAEAVRDCLDALCALRQRAQQEAAGSMRLFPAGELTDALATSLSESGWEVQCSRSLGALHLVRADVRWLRYVLETLTAAAGDGQTGRVIFQLHRETVRADPTRFHIRLLYGELPAVHLTAARQEILEGCRQVLAVMQGALLSQGFPDTVSHLSITLPIIVPSAL